MTEYWISQSKHWCDICKCWLNDTPQSRANHEKGSGHKINVQRKLREMRLKAEQEKKEEARTQAQMDKIEEAAERAYQKDMAALVRARPCAGTAAALAQCSLHAAHQWDLTPHISGLAAAHAHQNAGASKFHLSAQYSWTACKISPQQSPQQQIVSQDEAGPMPPPAHPPPQFGSWERSPESKYWYNKQLRWYYDDKSGFYYGGEPPGWTQQPSIPEGARFEVLHQGAEDGAGPH